MLYMQEPQNHPEAGQGLTEYGMVLVLVAVVIVVILALLGPQIGEVYSRIVDCVPPTAACTSS